MEATQQEQELSEENESVLEQPINPCEARRQVRPSDAVT
jgi:hypothetical protein